MSTDGDGCDRRVGKGPFLEERRLSQGVLAHGSGDGSRGARALRRAFGARASHRVPRRPSRTTGSRQVDASSPRGPATGSRAPSAASQRPPRASPVAARPGASLRSARRPSRSALRAPAGAWTLAGRSSRQPRGSEACVWCEQSEGLTAMSPGGNAGRDYVRQMRDAGYSDDEIREAMLAAGWAERDADVLLGREAAPPPPPPPADAPPRGKAWPRSSSRCSVVRGRRPASRRACQTSSSSAWAN